MRSSNGTLEPSAASTLNAPMATLQFKAFSAQNSPFKEKAVDACVPLSKASPSFGANAIFSSPAIFKACSADIRVP